MLCEYCGKDHGGLYGSGRFCSKKCSSSFSCSKLCSDKTKHAICKKCGDSISVDIRTCVDNVYCATCRNTKSKKICACCGSDICKDPSICNKKVFVKRLSVYGLDISKYGTHEIYLEVERIKHILQDMYFGGLSRNDIAKHFAVSDNIWYVLKQLGIKQRTLSDAISLNILQGKVVTPHSNKYKNGWHTTWNNNRVFYRSSYELEYCNLLDASKIVYEMESLRFVYWDSIMLKSRIAIPDFYIPTTNTIIEIKSAYTYDVQNMNDKMAEYLKHGYSFILIVDGITKVDIKCG